MAWASFAALFGKLMSMLSQVVLGHLLSVETYAVFAAATVALTLVSGFQNAGVYKNLVQQHDRYDEIVPDYSAFSIYVGLLGSVLLIASGFALSRLYDLPELAIVVCVSALSVPLASLNSVYSAKLSIELRFGQSSRNNVLYSFSYYAILMAVAFLGASYFSVAMATLLAIVIQYINHRMISGPLPLNWGMGPRRVGEIFYELRWNILASFLMGLSQNGNFFVLGRLLSSEEMGLYFFGFMLVANASILLLTAVTQTLLPLFAKLKAEEHRLRQAFLRSTGLINFLCGILCLGIIGFGPAGVHIIWDGKWDGAVFTTVVSAATFPIRVFASMAAITLESRGRWRSRTLLLAFDAFSLMLAAAAGGYFGGLDGAALAVAAQRALTGLLTYPFAARELGYKAPEIAKLIGRAVVPFAIPAAWLFFVRPAGTVPSDGWLDVAMAAGETCAAVALYVVLCFFVSRQAVMEISNFLKKRR